VLNFCVSWCSLFSDDRIVVGSASCPGVSVQMSREGKQAFLLQSFAGTNSVALPALPLFNIVVSKKLEKIISNVETERKKRPQMQEETRKNPAASPRGGVEVLVTVREPSPERGEGKRRGPLQICF